MRVEGILCKQSGKAERKNLKNDFSGHEKDDVISYVSALANMEGGHLVVGVEDKTLKIVGTDTYNYTTQQATLRLTNLCANLSSEGLDIEEFHHGGHP